MLNKSGETVAIEVPTITYDENKDEVISYESVEVANVLFGQPETADKEETMRLYGVEASWVLAVPKTYDGTMRDCLVTREFDGKTYRVVGDAEPYHPDVMKCFPGDFPWNRRVTVVYVDG